MRRFLPDTSVMVPAVCAWHEHHERAVRELETRLSARELLVVAAPALVEAYAVLTRLPPPHRLSPADAGALIESNFLANGQLVALAGKDYPALLKEAAALGVAGGRTYDWAVAACAKKAKVATLLTFNLRDFRAFPLDDIKIHEPGGDPS